MTSATDTRRPDDSASDTGAPNLVRRYFSDLGTILFRPKEFFGRMPLSGGLAAPLTFALVTNWIGSATGFLWTRVFYLTDPGRSGGFFGGALGQLLERFWGDDIGDVQSLRRHYWTEQVETDFSSWVFSVGPVILDPFFTLASILFTSLLVFIAARIFITPGKTGGYRDITYESSVRVVAYGMAPAIIAGVPLAGFWVAPLYTIVVTVIGAQTAYRTDTGRAIVVALFPKLLPIAIGMFFFFVVFAALIGALLA